MIDFVNVFQGTGGSVKLKAGSLSSKWNGFKGKAGNTSPGAILPFGAVACAPYSGGYTSGYGNFRLNYGLTPEEFFRGNKLVGFAHFTHSGSGAFGFYYNYLLTVPFRGELSEMHSLKDIDSEKASPGYYSCRFGEDKILGEVTVSEKAALHRYTSEDGKPFRIAVDISNNGLRQEPKDERLFSYAEESFVRIEDSRVLGYVIMQGVKLYFCIIGEGAPTLFLDKEAVEDRKIDLGRTEKSFGCLYEAKGGSFRVKIGFSLVSENMAKESALSAPEFDEARKNAEEEWEKRLSLIELYGVSDIEREIFYSNYYNTLIKPCGWRGESFLWDEEETFYLDFATLWDVYKTEIPLIFTLHPDVGRGIVKTVIRFGKERGGLFNALLLSSNMNIEATQACCLGCYVLYDAYVRGLVDESDVDGMFTAVRGEVGQYKEDIKKGSYEKTTKLLDCTLISEAFCEIAKELGRAEDEEYFSDISGLWTEAFSQDGLLKADYPYYEGNRWNYSFRLVRDVEKRIAIGGGKERLTEMLDAFFGLNDMNDQKDRFEGFNNETDMETPYFYHYVGRYDRVLTVVGEGLDNCFKTGRDGLPGNDDSGGLSACYLWNFLGLFPSSGQDVMLLGCPRAERAVLHLPCGKDLTVISRVKEGRVERITLNGRSIEGYQIGVRELLSGGELIFS